MAQQHTGHGNGAKDTATGMFTMALFMMAMCVGMALVVSLASAIGGPIAWTVAAVAILALVVGHMKLMNHGGH
jgi:hypothetical protein